jgi:hypothetical protein
VGGPLTALLDQLVTGGGAPAAPATTLGDQGSASAVAPAAVATDGEEAPLSQVFGSAPAEVAVTDETGQTTGVVQGEFVEQIPGSSLVSR